MNLWKETIEILRKNGKSFKDIVAIRGDEFQITKEDFVKYSNTDYDDGFGSPKVAEDLVVIGSDFWLERHEYDGSEWWEFKSTPKYKDFPFKTITALTVNQAQENGVDCSCGWENLGSLNSYETEEEAEQALKGGSEVLQNE